MSASKLWFSGKYYPKKCVSTRTVGTERKKQWDSASNEDYLTAEMIYILDVRLLSYVSS